MYFCRLKLSTYFSILRVLCSLGHSSVGNDTDSIYNVNVIENMTTLLFGHIAYSLFCDAARYLVLEYMFWSNGKIKSFDYVYILIV